MRDRASQVAGSRRAAALVAAAGRRLLLSDYFVLYLTLAYFAALAPFVPGLATGSNFESLLSNSWPLLVVAVGQTFVLIGAGIDLSQTAVMSVVSVVVAALITQSVQPDLFQDAPLFGVLMEADGGLLATTGGGLVLAMLAGAAIGALIGLLNGSAITRLAMPPFMVTLVSLTFFAAVAIWLTKSERIGGVPLSYLDLSELPIAGISVGPVKLTWSMVIAVAVVVAGHLLLSRTVFGRWLYAVGTNSTTAAVSGVPVARVLTATYVLSGTCAALGGILYSSRLGIGQPALGADGQVLLDIIGASVIGGTSLYGGKGKVLWTVFGVFFYVLLANSLNLLDLSFYTVTIVKGSVILAAVALDAARRRVGESESAAGAVA